MFSDDENDRRSSVIKLTGYDNYREWLFKTTNFLKSKSFWVIILGIAVELTTAVRIVTREEEEAKAISIIISRISSSLFTQIE